MATQGVKLDDRTSRDLKDLAKQKGHSPHWLMKTAIEQYIARESEYEREKRDDQERWDSYVMTGQSSENEEVVTWLADLAAGKRTPWHG